jgi:hypothetical protein
VYGTVLLERLEAGNVLVSPMDEAISPKGQRAIGLAKFFCLPIFHNQQKSALGSENVLL